MILKKNKQIKNNVNRLLPSVTRCEDYNKELLKYNILMHNEARGILYSILSEFNPSTFSLITTGSDGRLEKSIFLSPIELILIYRQRNSKKIKYTIEDMTKECPLMFYNGIETKNLEKDISIYYNDDKNKVYPGRPIDASLLLGSTKLFTDYKHSLIKELKDKKYGTKRAKKFFNKSKEPKKY